MKSTSKEYKDTLQHAIDVLDYNELKYDFKNHTLYIQHPTLEHVAYDYRFTTGKWAKLINRRNRLRKHYNSERIEDFIYTYVLDGNTEENEGPVNNEQYASS